MQHGTTSRASKGQWFIISAVVASSAFVIFSMLFRGYFADDSGKAALYDEDYFFWSVKKGLNRTLELSCRPDGTQVPGQDVQRNMQEFAHFSKYHLAKLGYAAEIIYDTNLCEVPPLGSTRMSKILYAAIESDSAKVWEGEQPDVDLG